MRTCGFAPDDCRSEDSIQQPRAAEPELQAGSRELHDCRTENWVLETRIRLWRIVIETLQEGFGLWGFQVCRY